MNFSSFTKSHPAQLMLIILSFLFISSVSAQNSFVLASQQGADSSQTFFEENDTLFMRVTSTTLDLNQMKKMRWEIKKEQKHGGMEYEYSGTFTNHYDGSFTSSINLSQLADSGKWEWKAMLKDYNNHEVELESYFYYISSRDSVSDSHLETEGFIQTIGGDSLMVNGYLFRVDSNTLYSYKDQQNITFADLSVDDFVEIKATSLDDGSYLASKIKLKDKDEYHPEFKTTGMIETLSDSSLIVNGISFNVNDQTMIRGHDDESFTLADLSVGQLVKIEAIQQVDNSYLAREIEIKEYNEHSMELEIKGTIDSIGVNYVIVSLQKIFVDVRTMYRINGTPQASFSDLQTAMEVEVEAYRQADSTLLARKIKVEDPQDFYRKIHFIGAIDSVGTDFIIVLGYTVSVDTNTVIVDRHYTSIPLTDLQKGQLVKVKGVLQDDGSVLADKIKVKDLWASAFEMEGAIESMGADWFVVFGITFTVDSNTVFYDVNKSVITFADLQQGITVQVKAQTDNQGNYLALMVRIKDNGVSKIEVTGTIQYLATDSIRVNDITFVVDSATSVYDLQGNAIDFSALQLAQIVEIKGILQNDGSFRAKYIKVEDDPNLMDISSALTSVTGNAVVVSNTEFRITPSTIVLNSNYQVIDLASLPLGQEVTVWAVPDANGNLEALQLQDASLGAATAIEEQSQRQIVGSFTLSQNYPNPFNPTTTIAFTLNGNRFSSVKLEVFNLLGQKVKTIFNGVLNNGNYSFQWNGKNETAQSVSSGIYFYRLQVNQKAQIRQMVLMK